MRHVLNISVLVVLFSLSGCKSAYYKTMETFGQHKRDILVNNVEDARDSQEQTKEQFKTALEKFTEVVNVQGGELKDKYEILNAEYEKSEKKANAMHKHIDNVETVAKDLFKEWEKELDEYTSDSLRRSSEKTLEQTKVKYEKLISAMRRAETKIDPVLSAFHDQVLFLKHNLNAQAIASLQDELVTIQSDIATLVQDMEKSIAEADAFINSMVE